ncbi:MAG: inorganic phosphate transporter [Flavobacteriales bacterium]
MEVFYEVAMGLLVLFAVSDLVVGVSNDAVNFLNSAIGSRVASRTAIMIFASVGILLGALLSNGMMEVARKGVLDPSLFYFSDLFFIFLAVMLVDVILLDVFNTLGLPTSTTVSVVFCLLGATFGIALVKIASPLSQEPLHYLGRYIKAGRALTIISGIFLSILISFVTGAWIHYFIRWAFSFDYVKRLRHVGTVWAGISLSSMTYFLIVKGLYSTLKGLTPEQITGFAWVVKDFLNWVDQNFYFFLFLLFLMWTLVAWILVSSGYDVLRFVVLYGTFSLAMAFAGNDLVNFIGVPIAGFQSYQIWMDAGSPDPQTLTMEGLSGNVHISSLVLLCAGMIMILTLWFSKKARTVADTEINLSRQDEGVEKFSSNYLARGIVRSFRRLGRCFFSLFPKRFLVRVEGNFKQKNQNETLAFDLVRASANLTISSILISIATAQKLPLSTTFVTFMVAMGTSLSDRAWDRESAVYRVAGVLQVVSGWFLTGLIAFTMAGLFAVSLYFMEGWALVGLLGLVVFVVYKNYQKHQKVERKKLQEMHTILGIDELTLGKTLNKTSDLLGFIFVAMVDIYQYGIEGLIQENFKLLQSNRQHYMDLQENFNATHNALIKVIRKTKASEPTAGRTYIKIYDKMQEIVKGADIITGRSLDHIINSHKPLKSKQRKNLDRLKGLMLQHLRITKDIMRNKNFHIMSNTPAVKNEILKEIDEQLNYQVMGIVHKKYGTKNTVLMLDLLLKSKDIVENSEKILALYTEVLSCFPTAESIIHSLQTPFQKLKGAE